MSNFTTPKNNSSVAIWLFTCCFFIFAMIALGGVTRLTESGLSITEWKPVSGIVPPFSESLWQEEFAKYRQSPEYIKKNMGMSLEEFKGIFWLEFIHRLVGRVTGLVFLLPLVYFLGKKSISRQLGLKLAGIFALGAFQGIVGWYMVKSGLKDTPHVSQYWLAFHLGMAFIIYGMVFWLGLTARQSAPSSPANSLKSFSICLIIAVFIQVILGAFVAGTHAGLLYNTFPDMNGQYIPDGLLAMPVWYLNFFENTTTIQFNHRIFAYITSLLIIMFWVFSYKFKLTKPLRYAIALLPIIVVIQIILGVLTLLNNVPVILASFHQLVALVIFTLVIFITHELRGRKLVSR